MQKAHRRRSADNRLAQRFRQTSNHGPWIAGVVGASALLGLLFLMNSGNRESLNPKPQPGGSPSTSNQETSAKSHDSHLEISKSRETGQHELSGTRPNPDGRPTIEANIPLHEQCPFCEGRQVLTGDYAKEVNSALRAVAEVDQSNTASLRVTGAPLGDDERSEYLRRDYLVNRSFDLAKPGAQFSMQCPNCAGSGWKPPRDRSAELKALMEKLEAMIH